MKKSLLMLTCSVLAISSIKAYALTSSEQMQAVKDIFIASFNDMDINKDGKVDQKEYLKYQFEKFRSNIIEADSFDAPVEDVVTQAVKTQVVTTNNNDNKNTLSNIKDSVNIMKSMADYTLEDEEKIDNEIDAELNSKIITKEDVMPEKLNVVTTDTGVDEEYIQPLEALNFEEVNADELKVEPKVTKEEEKDNEIQNMISIIKKSLPKEIDEITKWVDIKYQDKMVTYIYKADIDSSQFSNEDMAMLKESIEKDSCAKAYESMCPKIKPIFIDAGINLSILYTDKNDTNLSSCEFNQDTCK